MRLPLLPLAILLAISVAVDFYIWRSLRKDRKHRYPALVYAVSAVITLALPIVVVLLPFRGGDNTILETAMWLIFSYISVYVPKIIFVLIDLLASIPVLFKRHRWKPLRIVGIFCAVAVFLLMWWGALINRYNIDINRVEITGEDVPVGMDGFTIAQISDLHVGTYGNDTAFLSKLVHEVNACKADMIVFTGDVVNSRTDEIKPFTTVLSRLKAPYGVFSIMGNHDYGDYSKWPSLKAKQESVKLLRDIQERMGWKMLNNKTAFIPVNGDTLALVGVENVGDPPFHTYGSLSTAYPTLSDSRFKILLSHNPAHWDKDICDNDTARVALTLSGHTHAMQIELAGISPAAWRYKHWGGLYTDSLGHRLYVNIGSGTVGMPARIGATPEITVFTFRHK